MDILDNTAVDHFGHCFFLEDGGEKGNWFEGNLGMLTRKGVITPSDDHPTTFWIVSPLTTLINNVAAGSDGKEGFGIWYLFPDEPVGPSRPLGLFGFEEAKYPPISKFFNNYAHSNGDSGLALFKRLDDNHGLIGCSTYEPRMDKEDRFSNYDPVVFDTFTGI